MTAKYYVTLTSYGTQLVSDTHENQTIQLSKMVFGDANNVPYQPIDKIELTQLIHQTSSVEIREIKINNGIATVSAIIPANVGGFNIHEIGLIDTSGQLVYIGNYHGAYKPVIEEGGGGELEIVIDIKATAGAQALIEINPLIISASKTWVLEKFNELMDAINNKEDVKVGDLFITTLNFADSDAVTTHKKYGHWEKFGDGHALVSRASDTNGLAPAFMKSIGESGGEYTHKITKNEMPEHDHEVGQLGYKYDFPENYRIFGSADGIASDQIWDQLGYRTTTKSGDSQPHNNIQPSIIVDVWKRTA